MFHTGYVTSGILALVGLLLLGLGHWVFISLAVEFVVTLGFVKRKNGGLNYLTANNFTVGLVDLICYFAMGPMMNR